MKLFYRVYSSESPDENKEPPIIFLHGIAFSGNVFKKVAPVISRKTKRKAYVIDARNHGKSPWINEMNYDVLTRDLLEFMQQNAILKAVLIGSSMGGRTAINFALKYPEKVDTLVVEDMTPGNVKSSGSGNVVQKIHTIVQDLLKGYPPHTDLDKCKTDVLNILLDIITPTLCDRDRVLKHVFLDFIPLAKDGNNLRLECNLDVVLKMLENDSLVQNLPEQNATFNGASLFLYGSRGFFNLGKDPSVKKLFPRALVKYIEGASHFIHLDYPEEYTDIISDFILNGSLSNSKY